MDRGKIKLVAVLLLCSALQINAQYKKEKFDHWAIDVGLGIHKIGANLSDGYNPALFGQGNLGVRYMFNNRFGVRLDLGGIAVLKMKLLFHLNPITTEHL